VTLWRVFFRLRLARSFVGAALAEVHGVARLRRCAAPGNRRAPPTGGSVSSCAITAFCAMVWPSCALTGDESALVFKAQRDGGSCFDAPGVALSEGVVIGVFDGGDAYGCGFRFRKFGWILFVDECGGE